MNNSKRMPACTKCATLWIDQAIAASDTPVAPVERRQLIAALLARHHLLLIGPAGAGKRAFARALANILAAGQPDRVRVLRGHPWWAAHTGDVNQFVFAQENYNIWRLTDFVSNAIQSTKNTMRDGAPAHVPFVLVIEKMSRAETDIYFRLFDSKWSSPFVQQGSEPLIRLIGVLDTSESAAESSQIEPGVTCVFLGQASRRGKMTKPQLFRRL